ncbi:lipid droplet-associated protein [soil metagenome]
MKLPQTIMMYPMTIVSQVAQLVMKVQQDVADLVIKGDSTLENFFPPTDEQPEWATFDEDADSSSAEVPEAGERMTEGRFALYSVTENTEGRVTETATPAAATVNNAAAGIVGDLEYDALTLAQLRARLQSLSVGDLEELLVYEEATKARAPFQTLLANRITRATAK